jgi:hypothetical protein
MTSVSSHQMRSLNQFSSFTSDMATPSVLIRSNHSISSYQMRQVTRTLPGEISSHEFTWIDIKWDRSISSINSHQMKSLNQFPSDEIARSHFNQFTSVHVIWSRSINFHQIRFLNRFMSDETAQWLHNRSNGLLHSIGSHQIAWLNQLNQFRSDEIAQLLQSIHRRWGRLLAFQSVDINSYQMRLPISSRDFTSNALRQSSHMV